MIRALLSINQPAWSDPCVNASLETARQELADNGFVHLAPARSLGVLGHSATWAGFAHFWDNLPLDRYMRDGGTYRRRRFNRFTFDMDAGTLVPDRNQVFYQSAQVNAFAGGMDRHFDPLESAFIGHPVFPALVRCSANVLPALPRWSVDVHAIRILGRKDQAGQPTPEGIHRDGQDFVVQICIARSADAVGGESGIYDPHGRRLFGGTLCQPLEAIVMDDRRVLHGASAFSPAGAADVVTRDMLFFNFNAKHGAS
jgi:hypothetical protein